MFTDMSVFVVLISTTVFQFCIGFGFHHYRLLATSPSREINSRIDTLRTPQYRYGKDNLNIPLIWSKYGYWRRRRNSNRERTLQSIRTAVAKNHHLLKKRLFHYSPYLVKLRNANAKQVLVDPNVNYEINHKNEVALQSDRKNQEMPLTEQMNGPPNVVYVIKEQNTIQDSNPQSIDDSRENTNGGPDCSSRSEKTNKGLTSDQRYRDGDANTNRQLQFPKEKMKSTQENTRHGYLSDNMNGAKLIADDINDNSGFNVNTKEKSLGQSNILPTLIRDSNKHTQNLRKLSMSGKKPRVQNDQKSNEWIDDISKPVYTDGLDVHGVYLPNMNYGRNQIRNMVIDLEGDGDQTFQDPSGGSRSIQNSPSLRSDQLNDQKYDVEGFGHIQPNFGYQNDMDILGDRKMYIDAPKGRSFTGFGNRMYPDYPKETTGFGPLDGTSSIQSWGPTDLEPGFHIVQGPGEFISDESGCEGIETRRCSADSECSCYGLYVCIAQKCSTRSFSSDIKEAGNSDGTFMDFPVPIE